MQKRPRHSAHHLDRDLDRIRAAALAVPPGGWLRAIREALGMSMAQLGRRMGLPRQGVLALERREASGAVSLKTLREAAAALDAELVYAIVPRRSLARMLQKQARRKAGEELARGAVGYGDGSRGGGGAAGGGVAAGPAACAVGRQGPVVPGVAETGTGRGTGAEYRTVPAAAGRDVSRRSVDGASAHGLRHVSDEAELTHAARQDRDRRVLRDTPSSSAQRARSPCRDRGMRRRI